MDQLRLDVIQRGKGYVAESRAPEITAVGASPEEAAENARLMAMALFTKDQRPTTLLVRVCEPGLCTIIMQPLERAFSLAVVGEKPAWRYMASVSNVDPMLQAAK
jgi:hypothetical protein